MVAAVAAAYGVRKVAKKTRKARNVAVVVVVLVVATFMVGAVVPDLIEDDPPPKPGPTVTMSLDGLDIGQLTSLAAVFDVPLKALLGAVTIARAAPSITGCATPWWLLLGVARAESGGGTHDGASIDDDWVVRPLIFGPPTPYGRALGPAQFIPSSWDLFGLDGSGDGVADPHNFLDALLAMAKHLCSSAGGGVDLSQETAARAGLIGYNHDQGYVNTVWGYAVDYRVGSTRFQPVAGDTGVGAEPAGPAGTLVSIPLCDASDCELDAAWAPKLLGVLNLCRAQGFDIYIISANRTYAEQTALYARYLAGGGLAARPGTSNHEGGQAVDLSWTGGGGIGPGDGAWECVKDNGPRFGVYQDPSITARDSVHFSATGN